MDSQRFSANGEVRFRIIAPLLLLPSNQQNSKKDVPRKVEHTGGTRKTNHSGKQPEKQRTLLRPVD